MPDKHILSMRHAKTVQGFHKYYLILHKDSASGPGEDCSSSCYMLQWFRPPHWLAQIRGMWGWAWDVKQPAWDMYACCRGLSASTNNNLPSTKTSLMPSQNIIRAHKPIETSRGVGAACPAGWWGRGSRCQSSTDVWPYISIDVIKWCGAALRGENCSKINVH